MFHLINVYEVRDNYKDSLYFFVLLRELKTVRCSESD